MAHPKMYSDDDPLLLRLRALCLAFPDATEKEAFGRPTFRCGKIFAYYGQGQTGHPRPASIQVLPEADEREALLADARFYVPSYIGPYGWVGLDLSPGRAGLAGNCRAAGQLLPPDCPGACLARAGSGTVRPRTGRR